MKTEKNILVAFILNLAFSVFGFVGGIFSGSVAIASDALHDLGDAASIGLSYFFERKSRRGVDESYTYGYGRYSVLGGVITTLILIIGSVIVIYNAVKRVMSPVAINYDGMLLFAIVGVCVNFAAAYFTREKGSVNQRAINLHMLEDVLGWAVVLVGAVVMRFTDISVIDPLMSIGVSVFILLSSVKNLKEALDLFLEKTPSWIDVEKVSEAVLSLEGVLDVHHIHIWSLDGRKTYATMHIVTNSDSGVKKKVRGELENMGITHATIETETEDEDCEEKVCNTDFCMHHHHHH